MASLILFIMFPINTAATSRNDPLCTGERLPDPEKPATWCVHRWATHLHLLTPLGIDGQFGAVGGVESTRGVATTRWQIPHADRHCFVQPPMRPTVSNNCHRKCSIESAPPERFRWPGEDGCTGSVTPYVKAIVVVECVCV